MRRQTAVTAAALILILGVFISSCNTSGRVQLAGEAYEQRQFDKAARLYTQYYRNAPGDDKADIALLIARCYKYKNEYPKAEKWFARAIKLGSTAPEVALEYAQILTATEKYTEAIAQYRLYIKEQPTDRQAQEQLAFLKERFNK